ncbi:MAG: amino acid adenylation domain-containing protein [bacterium]
MGLNKKEIIATINQFNHTDAEYPRDKTIIDLFNDQVKLTPNNIAVVFNDKNFTYQEIDTLSNQLSNYLINNHQVKPSDFIGLMIERSEWIVISILGILKSGATYVPIDIDSPSVRKTYIKEDSNCKFTIDGTFIQNFINTQKEFDGTSINHRLNPESLAYVMYTSGTTGNPKGVMIKDNAVVNLITSQTKNYNLGSDEKFLQFSNYFFDASIEQIFLALFNGTTTVIVDKQTIKEHRIPEFLIKHKITHLNSTPSYLETIDNLVEVKSLKRIVAGGESCSINLAKKLSKVCDFYNAYGLTETTVTSTLFKYDSDENLGNILPIGKPIHNTKMHVLSKDMEILPVGTVGDLYLSGHGLAKGYLNLPELSKEKFIDNPFEEGSLFYKTGDLAKWLPDGNIEFLGRQDDQVKIGGYRLELGEVEAALNALPEIERATVVASDALGETKLVAYVSSNKETKDANNLRVQLSESLPEYMIPSLFMWLEEFPMTTNGKVDKKNLPKPEYQRATNAPPYRKPNSNIEKRIAKIWSTYLHIPKIGLDDNFFELGGNSLLTQKVTVKLSQDLNIKLPVTKIYQHQTIAALADAIDSKNKKTQNKRTRKSKDQAINNDVAVIGLAGRFPGASSIEELWEVLREGKETISFFSKEELDHSIPEDLKNDPLYVAARGTISNAKEFDAKFFDLNPKLAEAMDPQQRLLLEVSWEVLEKSGHLPRHYDGMVGVYAGTNVNSYFMNNVFPNKELMNQVGAIQANTVNAKDYVATRVAYHLNLKGPAVSVHSACSTSLLAISKAVEAIRNGLCDVAIAGGSSITSPINSGHLYQEGSMLCEQGHCRPFDKDATGTMFSDGAGVVLLKNLEQAKEDGDFIYGVVKGIGLNNDGGEKGSFLAPSIDGEAGAIKNAIEDAKINPSEITYVEAHGTATPLGDPIEIEGLCNAFGDQKDKQFCAIGSIKSNMGHLTAAAGVAGFIKVMLALKHKQIPASLGYNNPNPNIDFQNSPFFVNQALSPWNTQGLRKAGISSFGVGGTNVHVIVEEFKNQFESNHASKPLSLITWSAKSENSLKSYQQSLNNFIESNNHKIDDIAYGLHNTRDNFSLRTFLVASDKKTAKAKFDKPLKSSVLKNLPDHLAFMFPGQGAQYIGMAKDLYENEKVFKEAFNRCDQILRDEINLDIKSIIYPQEKNETSEFNLKDTKYTQPALFVVEYALAQLFISLDIKPTMLIGHSIGEFVAAHLAGVMNLKEALVLVAKRGKLVSELPSGGMLSVRESATEIEKILPENISIAAINSDRLCVVSGPDEQIEIFSELLKDKGIANMLLQTSHAFHSKMMNPALPKFKEAVEKVNLKIPKLPIISTVTGEFMTDSQATDVNYWVNHMRDTVNFSGAMNTMIKHDYSILLEVGPGRALTTLAKQKKSLHTCISSLTIPDLNESSYHPFLNALGELWSNGIDINWKKYYGENKRILIDLPSYEFDRKLCWADIPNNDFQQQYDNTNLANNNVLNELIISETPKSDANIEIMRKPIILNKIVEIVENNSGIEIEPSELGLTFLELGLDSLVLTQMAINLKNEFKTPITFRQLNGEFESPQLLADHLDSILPDDVMRPTQNVQPSMQTTAAINIPSVPNQSLNVISSDNQNTTLSLMAQQIQLLGKQIELMQGGTPTPLPTVNNTPTKINTSTPKVSPIIKTNDVLTDAEKKEHAKPFGASPKIEKKSTGISKELESFINELTTKYNKKTAGSKAYTEKHRKHMSDPRVVSGFKPYTKEMVYPIVVEKSAGNRLWDIDGNEYIDALNAFGACFFGHQPDFVKNALHDQIEKGFEIGPQHPLAGEVCELICEFTQQDRAALCNTGSEAVLGAMRIARTVTGRSLIVAFSKSYHGINDEVIVRGSKKLKTFPAASGIMSDAVQNMLILEYGSEESLKIIKERAHEIAAVLVEPVQSRRPELIPIEFLKEVRKITEESETILIFDEIITGFRMHPGGAQALFGIKADIGTYGKVIGGGMSIGAIAGSRKCMDALDGGHWQFGDDSIPEVGVTYFAGTFVRHPLALAATKASLLEMKAKGASLQDEVAAKAERLATELTVFIRENKLPIEITYYRSLWRMKLLEEVPYAELFFVMMRHKGFHIWDGFPCYMTTSFTQDDLTKLINACKECLSELIEVGIFNEFTSRTSISKASVNQINTPPVAGARLGKDESGNPAWFIADKNKKGSYVKIDL